MGINDWHWHEDICIAVREPKHHALVPCPALWESLSSGHAHGDICGLLVDRRQHRTRVAVESMLESVYPIFSMVFRTRAGMSTYVLVVISPAINANPVVTIVSQATRPAGSSAKMASSTASEMASAILSGCPR